MVKLKLRDIFDQDLDTTFSYRTNILVEIRDKNLGLLAKFINLAILIYIIVYVFIINKAYIQEEYSRGSVVTYQSGTAVSRFNDTVRIWDAVDAAYPAHDPSAITLGLK